MFADRGPFARTHAVRRRADAAASDYLPRRPTETVLHALVRDHLEPFLDHAQQNYARGLPRYVEQAFRDYLTCGVFVHGFLRLHCDHGRQDLLVAFSCQGRGICPRSAGRRMANTAAHLFDRVLPAVPVRQWVLSLPFELRNLAAFRADVARALGRIFIEVIALEHLGEVWTGPFVLCCGDLQEARMRVRVMRRLIDGYNAPEP